MRCPIFWTDVLDKFDQTVQTVPPYVGSRKKEPRGFDNQFCINPDKFHIGQGTDLAHVGCVRKTNDHPSGFPIVLVPDGRTLPPSRFLLKFFWLCHLGTAIENQGNGIYPVDHF